MSIALLITLKDDPEPKRIVPVATEVVFDEMWRPGYSALDLQWIPLFKSGVSVSVSKLPAVVEELAALRDWMRAQPAYEHQVERISLVIAEVSRVLDAVDPEIFFG